MDMGINEIYTPKGEKRNLQAISDLPLQVEIHTEALQHTVSGPLGETGTVDYLPWKREPTRTKKGQLNEV